MRSQLYKQGAGGRGAKTSIPILGYVGLCGNWGCYLPLNIRAFMKGMNVHDFGYLILSIMTEKSSSEPRESRCQRDFKTVEMRSICVQEINSDLLCLVTAEKERRMEMRWMWGGCWTLQINSGDYENQWGQESRVLWQWLLQNWSRRQWVCREDSLLAL